jgi:outer membrane protein
LFNLEKARIELQKAQSSLRVVYQTIMTQSGIDEDVSEFSVDGEFEQTEFTLSIDSVLVLLRKKNPDIIKLQGAEEIQDNLVRIARAEFYPAIYAGASINGYGFFNDASDISDPGLGNEGRIYVGLSWDIFSGLSKIYRLKQAEAEREKFKIAQKKVVETLELQARNAYEQVLQSNNNLLSTRSLIQLAEKRYLIARKAFEVGSKTILEVQNAEFELNSAKMSLNAAQFSFQSALISLKLLMGDI